MCRRGGAYGARLTGAGWGGCVVSLVDHHKADAFVEYLKVSYSTVLSHGFTVLYSKADASVDHIKLGNYPDLKLITVQYCTKR